MIYAERRDRFATEYVNNGLNGTQAAIAAGCPPAGARVAAHRMIREPRVRQAIVSQIWDRLDQRRRVFTKTYLRPWTTDDPGIVSASAAARAAGCPRPGSRVAAYRLVREPLVNFVIMAALAVSRERSEREYAEWERQMRMQSDLRLQSCLAAIRRR
jgi:hypothetical protein